MTMSTIEAIAHGLQRRLVIHPELDALLQQHWAERPLAARAKMASVPEGAQLLMEPSLPIPVLQIGNVYIFPGIPQLFHASSIASRSAFGSCPITSAWCM